MTRKEAREQAFILIFEKSFREESMEEIIADALEHGLIASDDYVEAVTKGVEAQQEALDARITANLKGWTLSRLSRVALAALRLAVYEMLYMQDIPTGVSINEAVELTKKFATEDDAAYINGVLGTIAREGAHA